MYLIYYYVFGLQKSNYTIIYIFSKEDSIKMAVSTKNIVAYPKRCTETNCDSCSSEDCLLCSQCMDEDTKVQLTNAYREYIDKHDCKRVFPPKFVSEMFN